MKWVLTFDGLRCGGHKGNQFGMYSKVEKGKEERKASPPPLCNCHVLPAVFCQSVYFVQLFVGCNAP